MSCLVDVAKFDGFDYYSFYKSRTTKAKKEHKCGECGSIIKIGELYEHEVMKGEDFNYERTCLICKEIRDQFCCSWYYGMVWEHIMEAIDYGDFNIGCLDGLSRQAVDKFIDKYDKYFGE